MTYRDFPSTYQAPGCNCLHTSNHRLLRPLASPPHVEDGTDVDINQAKDLFVKALATTVNESPGRPLQNHGRLVTSNRSGRMLPKISRLATGPFGLNRRSHVAFRILGEVAYLGAEQFLGRAVRASRDFINRGASYFSGRFNDSPRPPTGWSTQYLRCWR